MAKKADCLRGLDRVGNQLCGDQHPGRGISMVRISEVAEYAGVSTATVSRVLNGKRVNPAMANAVRDAVAALGYTPDRTARSLRTRSSRLIALVLPNVENPFFTAVARGVEDAAKVAGYSVVLCNSDDDTEKEASYLQIIAEENMAGVIIAPASDTPALAPLGNLHSKVVVIDRSIHAEVDQVTFDNVALGQRITEQLIAYGFQRIACVTGPRRTSTAVDRAFGWRRALSDAGIASNADSLLYANFRVDGGYQAMETLLRGNDVPDAVIATNNLVGVGVLRALEDHGGGATLQALSRPSERPFLGVGVIGDLPFATSSLADVSLTSLNPRGMGETAAGLLLERISGVKEPTRRLVQPV